MSGLLIPIPDPERYTIPPSGGFEPTGLGVVDCHIKIHKPTNAVSANLVPCPCTETAWGEVDYPHFSTGDVAGEIGLLPDGPDKMTAAGIMQSITVGLPTLYKIFSDARKAREQQDPPPEGE